jgi:hypothetical protein
MRKVFRMQYEPCNGDCYAWDRDDDRDDTPEPPPKDKDILPLHHLMNDRPRLKALMEKLVAMHQPLCGNRNLRYGIDLDEDKKLFIGSFWHYGRLELFTDTDMTKLIETMADYVLNFYTTDAYKEESKGDEGLGHSVCHYGEDDNLRRFIIRTSKIPTPNGVDAYIKELMES